MCFLEKKGNQTVFQKATENGLVLNRAFWNLVKPFLSNKGGSAGSDISLVKNNEIVTDDQQLTEIFNDHYINIADKSNGVKPCNIADTVATNDDRQIIRLILQKYKKKSKHFSYQTLPKVHLALE